MPDPQWPPAASAYERAATACASRAAGSHEEGDSFATTPRTYESSESLLIAASPDPVVISMSPRNFWPSTRSSAFEENSVSLGKLLPPKATLAPFSCTRYLAAGTDLPAPRIAFGEAK